jgi:hypothetical protein
VYVEEVAASPRIAFDAAAGKLERRLVRLSESDRDRRRHPKKYFVAAQAWH